MKRLVSGDRDVIQICSCVVKLLTDVTRLNLFEVARAANFFSKCYVLVRGTRYEVARRTSPVTMVK